MVEFSKAEERFLNRNELGRLATASQDGMPHIVSVGYIYQTGNLLIAIDYETKKYQNLLANKKVAFVVDLYRPSVWHSHSGEGEDSGNRTRISGSLQAISQEVQLGQGRSWKEGEAPFIMIEPTKKAS